MSSLSGARTSQSLMLLSTDAVAMTQSLYLHQSADRISKACAAMLSVGRACRKSQIFTLQSPDALMKTSACAGFLHGTRDVYCARRDCYTMICAQGNRHSLGRLAKSVQKYGTQSMQ